MRKSLYRIIALSLSIVMLVSGIPADVFATEIEEDSVEVSDALNDTEEVIPEDEDENDGVATDVTSSNHEIEQESVPDEADADGDDIVEDKTNPKKADRADTASELELVSINRNGGEAYFTEIEVEFPDDYDLLTDNVIEEVPDDVSELMSSGNSYWDKFSCNYFYDQMTYEEQNLYDRLYAINYELLTTTDDVSYDLNSENEDDNYEKWATTTLSKPTMLKVATVFRLENPQFYFLSTRMMFGSSSGMNRVAIGIYDKFVDGDERAEETAYIRDTIEEWYDGIPYGATDLAKEVYIQNKIVDSIIYDPRISAGEHPNDELSRFNQSCYSILGKDTKYTVCAGYAQTFALLMNGLDIDTVAITSYNHEWNKIKLYGRWYLTDVTWDDTKTNGRYSYTHFNISESHMDSIDGYMPSYPGGSYNIDGNTVSFNNPKDHDEMTSFEGYNGEYTYLWPRDLPTAETNVGSDKESAYSAYNGYSGSTITPVITSTASGDEYSIKITSGTSGASIYYVTYDESTGEPEEPSESYSKSRLYSGTFTVPSGTVIKAIACMDGYNDSAVTSLLAGTHSSSNSNNVSTVTSVKISDSTKNIAIAESFRLHAYCMPTYASQSSRKLYWFTSNASVASIESSNASSEYVTVKGLKAGTATITASTSSTNSGTVKAQCVVTVSGSGVSINRIKVVDRDGNTGSDINIKTQTSVSLTAQLNTGANGTGQLTWSCDNEAISLTPSADTLSCLAECDEVVASATITATAGNGVKGSYNISFYMPAEGLSFDKSDMYLRAGYLNILSVNLLGDSTEVVSWSTTDPNIAYVYSYDETDAQHKKIYIAGNNPGDTVLTASIPSGSSATCNIHVYDVPVESVSIVDSAGRTYTSASDYKNVPKGSEFVLSAVVTPDNAGYPEACEWSVWGTNSSYLKLTDNKDGTCTVKVLDGFWSGSTYTTYVRVQTYNYKYAYFYTHPYIPVTSVELKDSSNKTSSDRSVGDSFDVTASFNSDYDTNLADTSLTWVSSDTSVATVTGYTSGNTRKATINAVGSGTAVITARASNGVSGTYTVKCHGTHTVTFNANGGICSTTSKTIKYGETYGDLPEASRTGYDFVGWYTDTGDKVKTTDKVLKDITLYAHWTAKQYTLTLDANGGNFGSATNKTKTIAAIYGQSYGSLDSPEREGYDFSGWYTAKDGGTVVTAQTKHEIDGVRTVYARWTAKKYKVTFNANGGTCAETSRDVTFDETYGTLPDPTREGYSFIGWYTKPDGDGVKITATNTVSIAGDHTLYASWSANSYTVTFDANGGSCSTDSQSVTYGSTYASLPEPSRVGYVFDGWYTVGTDEVNITTETPVSIAKDHTLCAHWTGIECNVTFDSNGGWCLTWLIPVTYGEEYGTLPVPWRNGYTFAGWFTEKNGGTLVEADTIVSCFENHELHAHWNGNTISVSYDPGGGICSASSKNVTVGDAYGELPVPTKTGYDFAGWFNRASGGTEITSASTVTAIAEHTIYAHWTPSEYTVTFVPKGGECDPSTKTVTYDSEYGELPNPTKVGYTFDGWYDAETCGNNITASNVVNKPNDHNLYAYWTPNIYKVNFYGNGGTPSASERSVTYDSTYGAQGALPTADREGYDFVGWFTEETGGTQVTGGDIVKITSTQNLYAHWTGKKYKAFFDNNGGLVGTTEKEIINGAVIGDLPEATREGYEFAGWYTSVSGGSVVTAETTVNTVSNITLYARWTAEKFTVIFDANDGECLTAEKEVTYDSTYGDLPVATRTGYTHSGWYTDKTYANKVESTDTVRITEDQTLYARWTENEYTVTYDANGGAIGDTDTMTRSVTYDHAYGDMPEPVRDGYDFIGWYTAASGGTLVGNTTIVATAGAHRLYARWQGERLTVTFDARNGTLTGSNTRDVFYGDSYGYDNGVQASLPTPQYEGHDFAGWFTAAEGGKQVTDTTAVENSNPHTLYAHWTIRKVTVILKANGGTFANGSEEVSLNEDWGTKIKSEDLPRPSYGNHKFKGWYTDKSCKDPYDFDAKITDTAPGTLYAGWSLAYTGFKIVGLEDVYYEYTGTAVKPAFEVRYYDENTEDDRLLESGIDYTITYANNVNAGGPNSVNAKGASISPTVTVKGKGNYSGTTSEAFEINALDIADAYTDTDAAVERGEDEGRKYYHLTLSYNKKNQKVAPVLKMDLATGKTVTLKKGTDYDLSINGTVTDVVNAPGEYDVTVKGKGNYSGTRTLNVIVTEVKQISKAKFPSIPNQTYDSGLAYILAGDARAEEKRAVDGKGNEFEWNITTGSGKSAYTLVFGTDYDLAYEKNIDAGTATVTVIGLGDYSGTVRKTFKINAIPMSKATFPSNISLASDCAETEYFDPKTKKFKYTGKAFCIAGPEGNDSETYGVDLEYKASRNEDAVPLEKGTDYVVTYQKNVEPGTATIIFTGKGDYTGSVKKTFGIQSYKLNEDIEDYSIEVRYYDKTLTEYEWSPEDEAVGTGDVPSYTYVKDGIKPEPHVYLVGNGDEKQLEYKKDYTLSWSNYSKPAGYDDVNSKGKSIAPTVTITGKGRYSGKITRTYTITGGILNPQLSATDVLAAADKTGIYTKTKLTVKDSGGKVLKSGTDYYAINDKNKENAARFEFADFGYGHKDSDNVLVKNGKNLETKEVNKGDPVLSNYIIPVGAQIKVTVTGKGLYEYDSEQNKQTTEGFFWYAGTDISKVAISMPSMVFENKEITADEIRDNITQNGKASLKIGKPAVEHLFTVGTATENDKELLITSVTNNVNTGTAKFTLKGNPLMGYVGEKTVTFKIVSKAMNHTVRYHGNNGIPENESDPTTGLMKALLDADHDPGKDLEYYKENYRITPNTRKESSTPINGKLTKNPFTVQKYNGKRWVNIPAKEISFKCWNNKPDGSGLLTFKDQAIFAPSWILRFANRSETWDLYAQWDVK